MEPSPVQTDLVAAFEEGRVEGVSLAAARIDTHISHVFLTADRAFKLKRAVTLPFLDFSTLDQRHKACLAELEVNQRLAGAMYLGVRPVVETAPGHYRIGGEGPAMDWVVEMKRFDQTDQFDELARAGRLTPELIDQTADMIAAAHSAFPPVTTAGHAADYRGIIQELQKTESHGAEQLGLLPGDLTLFAELDTQLAHIDPLIEARRRAGKVHRTHGDLHLRNICLFEGLPTPFDALEFNARLATTDRLYDLAYLLMDLIHIGHRTEACRLMNRYWDVSDEAEAAFRVLPFFIALRAAVRMAVDVEAGQLAEANQYRQLAHRVLSPQPPRLICIGGLSGSGKSTIARLLAPQLPGPVGARLLRSDVLRKREKAQALEAPLTRPEAYSPAARASIYETLFDHGQAALEAGTSVILDATFQAEEMRRAAKTRFGAQMTGIWLDAPLDVRLKRIAGRHGDASDADAAVAAAQQRPETLGPGWQRVEASASPEDILRELIRRLAE